MGADAHIIVVIWPTHGLHAFRNAFDRPQPFVNATRGCIIVVLVPQYCMGWNRNDANPWDRTEEGYKSVYYSTTHPAPPPARGERRYEYLGPRAPVGPISSKSIHQMPFFCFFVRLRLGPFAAVATSFY